MHISKFRIHNYKSYLDSGDVYLDEGINIITGQNNAGKTALLQVLSLQFVDIPHKSTRTIPTQLENVNPESLIDVEFNVSREEFQSYIFNSFSTFSLPVSEHVLWENYNGKGFLDNYLKENNKLQISFRRNGGGINNATLIQLPVGHSTACYSFNVDRANKRLEYTANFNVASSFYTMAELIKQRFYFFHAERLNIGSCAFGTNPILASNASNLPETLNLLQGNPDRFARYNEVVKKIFPQIFRITIRPKLGNQVEIVVWNEDPKFEREDLLIPLSECGTGLGQVLSILYVVITSDIPKIIIIDEPNSFLHPGAARKLIEILKEHPQHQFIISTHSPSTIAAANPKTINIIKTKDAQSYVEEIDINEVNQQQLYLAEIGVKLSDVFGSDNILWVEGKTEEICFPKIIEATQGLSLMGTTILGVKNTGDFLMKKTSSLIFDIYTKLSKGQGLMPQAVGFIFDREGNTDTEIADLRRQSKGKVEFIPRRLYENYLLNSSAIYSILNSIDGVEVTLEAIIAWIEKNKWEKKYISKDDSKTKTDDSWHQKIDGANFLKDLFNDLTSKTVQFDKIKHSVALTEWIVENAIEDLKELQGLLSAILSREQVEETVDRSVKAKED